MRLTRILETCLYVDDLSAAQAFYVDILGLQEVSRVDGRHLFLHCGDAMFLLFIPEQTERPTGEVPTHGARGPGHVAFAVAAAELPAWQARLAQARIAVEAAVDWPGGGRSLYVRDPAGNSVELTTPLTWGLPEDPADP
jgi:catechol 2,3-dioxygenase-like lactoylglutathione lyase family enzyme